MCVNKNNKNSNNNNTQNNQTKMEGKLSKKEKKLKKMQERTEARKEAARAAEAADLEAREALGKPAEIDGVRVPRALYGYVERLDENRVVLRKGLVPGMRVDGVVYVNRDLLPQMFAEYENNSAGFVGALQQVANVASVPGVVRYSLAMPDAHSGYGFSIGGVAAMDTADPAACVCPGGVGYDINCGVCLLRTNLDEACLKSEAARARLADALFASIPVGVGCEGGIDVAGALDAVLREGLPWLVARGLAWPEDVEHCEERGCVAGADPALVSERAKARGRQQVGTLGSGNHYIEVQAVDEIYDETAAAAMGLARRGQLCVMIHSGSRGLGHQICTDALRAMQKSGVGVPNANDPQLAGVPIASREGQEYLAAMACGANFAFANRGTMRQRARAAFASVFGADARDLDMHLVYDVCHNLAKLEDHVVDGEPRRLLVHRKGATRAFPPGHPSLPECYRAVGQPVIIGGSMGTCSYVLTGTQHGMDTTFGSTCHGAGRALSRSAAMKQLPAAQVMDSLARKGVVLRIATPNLVAEEAAEAYKDVSAVVQTCHDAGISKLCVRLRPIIVCKG